MSRHVALSNQLLADYGSARFGHCASHHWYVSHVHHYSLGSTNSSLIGNRRVRWRRYLQACRQGQGLTAKPRQYRVSSPLYFGDETPIRLATLLTFCVQLKSHSQDTAHYP